jgi:spermidine synthase
MGFFSRWKIHKAVCAGGDSVDVSEQDGVRSLHLGNDTVQSAMRLARPNDLELAYTRCMMSFLLFHPQPERVLMIGLGGGSLAKFIYHYLPQVHATAVEINPRVAAIASSHFFLPPEVERFHLVLGDGAEYVAACSDAPDVIMVDGFDSNCQVEELATQSFYDNCRALLADHGVLVVNLWGSDRSFDVYLQRIETAFDGLILCLHAERRGNIIVLGFKKSPGSPRWSDLKERAKELEERYGLEFLRFLDGFKEMNLHTEKRLLL